MPPPRTIRHFLESRPLILGRCEPPPCSLAKSVHLRPVTQQVSRVVTFWPQQHSTSAGPLLPPSISPLPPAVSTTHDAGSASSTGSTGAGVATIRASVGRGRRRHGVLAGYDRADVRGHGRARRAAAVGLCVGQAKASHGWEGRAESKSRRGSPVDTNNSHHPERVDGI